MKLTKGGMKLTGLLLLCSASSVLGSTFHPCVSDTGNEEVNTKCQCSFDSTVLQCEDLTFIPSTIDLPTGFKPTMMVIQNSRLNDITRDQLLEYRDLRSLQMVNCKVTNLENGTFMSMNELTYLELDSNSIQIITEHTFLGLSKLKTLSLKENQLAVLPPTMLKSMPELTNLDLSNNRPLRLHDDFFQGSKITHLTLSAIDLSSIPTHMLSKAKSLENIMLDHNKIPAIGDNAFAGLPNLDFINLDSNKITTIHNNAFKDLSKLRHLNLGNNKINKLTVTMMKPVSESLEEVLLENNMLETLEVDVIRHDKIQMLRLGHNPWVCDCKIRWMKELDLQHKDPENVTCNTPQEYNGHSISNVTAEMLCSWCEGCGNSTVALAVGIPILIICVCLIVYYLYRIMQNRKQRAQIRKGYKYSNVYKDTVEPVRSNAPVAQIS